MSTQPKITDDEMRYFQFKARQLFLLRKEDHDWNEFCKRNTCTCSSCQPEILLKMPQETGVIAPPKKKPPHLGRTTNLATSVQSRNLPRTLNEIKTKLDRIDFALSQMAMPSSDERLYQQIPSVKLLSNIDTIESSLNPVNAKRIDLIQNSLKASLRRLQSSALWKNTGPPVKVNKKNSGFFLPHDLQKKRIIARNAYLASLAKTRNTAEPSNSGVKEGPSSKQDITRKKLQGPKAISKTRKVNNLKVEKEVTSMVSERTTETKDEHIESAVDGIVDDLMGETVLLINKIKHIKGIGKTNGHQDLREMKPSSPLNTSPWVEVPEKSDHLPLLGNWAKVRENLFRNLKSQLKQDNSANSIRNVSSIYLNKPEVKSVNHGENNFEACIQEAEISCSSQNKAHKTVFKYETLDSVRRRELCVDPKIAKETAKHRKEYMNYLERISRARKGHFDPQTLANMIAESLLDECIDEVSQELQDIPSSLITDLYDQEFLQSI